jgi:hypothetical protein
MPSLRSTLDDLAHSFASSVLSAIRGASLVELLSETGGAGGARRGPGRPRSTGSGAGGAARAGRVSAGRPKTGKGGRLARRSAADIEKALGRVVTLLKSKKAGLRAEQIRTALQMQSKEMPRILKQGLSAKKLSSKGEKRATTYFAR